jgi:hypothetical protein
MPVQISAAMKSCSAFGAIGKDPRTSVFRILMGLLMGVQLAIPFKSLVTLGTPVGPFTGVGANVTL